MLVRKAVSVEVVDGVYTIDGHETFAFETGIEYVLRCSEPIFLNWTDIENNYDVVANNTTSTFKLVSLTTGAHHSSTTDNMIYWASNLPIYDRAYTQIGLMHRWLLNDPIDGDEVIADNRLNRRIVERARYVRDLTEEEVLNLTPQDYASLVEDIVAFDLANNPNALQWEGHENYIAVINGGVRLPSTDYSAVWQTNGDNNILSTAVPLVGTTRIMTDLVHHAVNNGSTEVTLTMPPGDNRAFYINNADRSNTEYVCRGIEGPANRVFIRQAFDSYLLGKYPKIYDVLLKYVRMQSMRSEPMSYLNNMMDYISIDKMPDHLVKRALKQVFSPFETTLANKRNVYKHVGDLFSIKGTAKSYNWLSNSLFHKTTSITRFYELIFTLAGAKWHDHTLLQVLDTDVTNTDIVGRSITGRKSGAIGVVESLTLTTRSNRQIYEIEVTMKSGIFDQDEVIEVEGVSINDVTVVGHEMSVIGVSIEQPGTGYVVGDQIISDSTTGEGFEAYVASVDSHGGVKSVEVKHGGWFYRDYQLTQLRVVGDTILTGTNYSPLLAGTNAVSDVVDWRYEFAGQKYVILNVGSTFDVNGSILNADLQSLPNAIAVGSFLDERRVICTSLTEFHFRNMLDSYKTVAYAHPSAPLALHYSNHNIIVAYFDHVSIISVAELEAQYRGEIDTVSPVDIAHAGPGIVTGVGTYGNELFVFDSGITWLYVDGVLSLSAATDAISSMISKKVNGVVTHTFTVPGAAYSFKQQFVDDESANAVMESIFGRVVVIRDGYKCSNSLLSGSSILNDNNLITPLSIGTELAETTNAYELPFDDLINPTGFKSRGIYRIDQGTVSIGGMFVE